MHPEIEGWEFETACGKFRVKYLGEPTKDDDRHRWEYWILFKWIDPHDETNKATPEYKVRIDLFEEDMLADDAEHKLFQVMGRWIDEAAFVDEVKLSFSYDAPYLKPRAIENSN